MGCDMSTPAILLMRKQVGSARAYSDFDADGEAWAAQTRRPNLRKGDSSSQILPDWRDARNKPPKDALRLFREYCIALQPL